MTGAQRDVQRDVQVTRVIEIPGEYAPGEDETGAEFRQLPTV